jgi:Tol biopolymer transport system component
MLSSQDMFPVRKITSGPIQNGFASWVPDSKSLIHQISSWNDTLSKNGLWIVSPKGKVKSQIFKGIAEHPKWSPNGKRIAFNSTRLDGFNIWIMDVDIEKIKRDLLSK